MASACPSPLALSQAKRQQAIVAGDNVLSAISDQLKRGERSQLDSNLEHLHSLFDLVQMADELTRLVAENKPSASTREPAVPNYFVSSWFIAECHAYLTSHPNGHERLHLVTGVKVSPRERTLERMVKVGLESASEIGALADQRELQKALIEMDEWGHSLHGLFHSHPGKGAQATQPSDTDWKTHERYERGGYPLVGAIFVKDGFIRFFAHRPFTITVYGKGAEQVDEHVFILTLRHLPHQAPPKRY